MEQKLQELTSDLAQALQLGSQLGLNVSEPRFSTEVVDFNRFDIIDSDGREYIVIVKEKE